MVDSLVNICYNSKIDYSERLFHAALELSCKRKEGAAMRKRNLARSLACALLAALAVTLPASASDAYLFGTSSPNIQIRTAPVMLVPQDTGIHTKYMNGSDGWFFPEQAVTRAELAQMLMGVVADVPASSPWFSDVSPDSWYAPAVQCAAGLGLMTGENGLFRPDAPATRAECAAALALVLPYGAPGYRTFPDVRSGYWAYEAISRVATYGLFLGDSTGNFYPDSGLKRCEAVAVFNRLLGRTPDMTYLAAHATANDIPRTFPDVPQSHWAYWDIMEATVTHQCAVGQAGAEQWLSAVHEPSLPTQQPSVPPSPTLPDGPRRIDGRLYWIVNGEPARNQNISGLYFDENGCYTTGNAELDGRLNAIVEELTNDSMTRDEKLEALFNYVRDHYTYLKRPLISKDQTDWEPEYALYFLQNGKGNCYNFSAAYCLLCRELGLPAYTVVGSALNSPHSWVEIVLDGSPYIFDPQLAWRYLHDWDKTGYNFFKQPAGSTTVQYTR